ASPKVEVRGGPGLSSLRRHLHRQVDPERRGLPKRMRCKIVLRDQRHIGGPDRICERLLIATLWVRGGRQADPVAMRADHLRSMLKSGIQLARSGRQAEIEALCAHPISNSELLILSCNTAREERAGNYGGAKDGPGTHESSLGVHVNLRVNFALKWFGSLTTSPHAAIWTPLNSR